MCRIGNKSRAKIVNLVVGYGKSVDPWYSANDELGEGLVCREDKLFLIMTLDVPAHQTTNLSRLLVKPRLPLHLMSLSPFLGFGPVGFISHTCMQISLSKVLRSYYFSWRPWFGHRRSVQVMHPMSFDSSTSLTGSCWPWFSVQPALLRPDKDLFKPVHRSLLDLTRI